MMIMMMMMMFVNKNYNKSRVGSNETTPGGRTKITFVYYIRIQALNIKFFFLSKGLVQLHMLLESWNGPPDFDREVPAEVSDHLSIC
jgi:hypothetical protein